MFAAGFRLHEFSGVGELPTGTARKIRRQETNGQRPPGLSILCVVEAEN